jgi:protein-S-isoprenylcysteine O-methyltransferase Ste14
MKRLSSVTLLVGMIVLLQGAIAVYWRVNVFNGTRYGPSLTPVYIILAGILICLIGLTLRTFADRRQRRDSHLAEALDQKGFGLAGHGA